MAYIDKYGVEPRMQLDKYINKIELTEALR